MSATRSLRARAWSVAILLFLLVVLLGVFSLWRLEDYDVIVGDIRDRYLQNTQFLGDLNNFTSDFRAAEASALLASNPDEVSENEREIKRLDDLIALAQHSFEHVRNDPTTTGLYRDFVAKWRGYRSLADQVLGLSNNSRQGEGVTLYRTKSRIAYDAASDSLGLLTERNRRAARDASGRADEAYRQARYLTTFAVIIAGVMVLGGLFYIRRTILRPLLDLARRIRRLAENDMDIETGGVERLDEVGEMARAIAVFRNNAIELAQSQRALAENLAHERQLTELQRNFVSMASHEFRTPLTIIDGQAQRLINAGDRLTPDDIAQRARNIRTAVTRLTSVIDNLIDASRLMDSPPELYFHPAAFDLAASLREICHLHRELTPTAQITEQIDGGAMPIIGDQKLLFQVFHNIISNAVKYSPDGAVVHVAARLLDDAAVVTIEDQGLGIPRADRERLFERYYRGRNVAGIVGSGIGLYLAKTVIDLHRGHVTVESEEGQGARFTVAIPVSQIVDNEAAGYAERVKAASLNAVLSK